MKNVRKEKSCSKYVVGGDLTSVELFLSGSLAFWFLVGFNQWEVPALEQIIEELVVFCYGNKRKLTQE